MISNSVVDGVHNIARHTDAVLICPFQEFMVGDPIAMIFAEVFIGDGQDGVQVFRLVFDIAAELDAERISAHIGCHMAQAL